MTKFISGDRVKESIRRLSVFHIFFGTTFLVLSKNFAPKSSTIRITLDAENRKHLQKYFRLHPKSDYFFTPFQVKKNESRWRTPKYASTSLQAINTQAFSDAILHVKNESVWGWTENYIDFLKSKLPSGDGVPLIELAIWFYRDMSFDDNFRGEHLISEFVKEFGLGSVGLNEIISFYFDESEYIFSNKAIDFDSFSDDFGLPPDVEPQGGAILQYLEFSNIGPPKSLTASLAPRLNVLTGDNGLGKTFFLDIAWWALTRAWIDHTIVPLEPVATAPQIKFSVSNRPNQEPITAEFSSKTGRWKSPAQSAMSGLVIYARVDGSFAVWDPANPALAGGIFEKKEGFANFTRENVWTGGEHVEGILRDWVRWQTRSDEFSAFETFKKVIQRLKPPDLGEFSIGRPQRIPGWPMEIPTLVHPYGTVPVVYESAGIKRILTLTYLIVWAWEEHKVQARTAGRKEERQMIILLDEAEAHLHPRWQRVLLEALLGISKDLHEELSIQYVLASHSPLLLASAETIWDVEKDKLFHLQIDTFGEIKFNPMEFEILGSVDSWLRSPSFDNLHPGSEAAENSLNLAKKILSKEQPSTTEIREISGLLSNNLAADDPFWMRWMIFAAHHGVSL